MEVQRGIIKGRGKDLKIRRETENEESSFKAEYLTDLPVAEEQAHKTNGGAVVTEYELLECRFRDANAK